MGGATRFPFFDFRNGWTEMKKAKNALIFLAIAVFVLISRHTAYADMPATHQQNLSDVIARVMPSVCRLTAWEEDLNVRWEKLWHTLNDAKNQDKNLINIPHGVRGELGSCFIRNAEAGIIITANHVIQDKNFFVMQLMGNAHEYILEKVGSDAATDIAVLRIKKPADLPLPVSSIIFGNSNALRPGDTIFAVGYPAPEMDGVLPRDEIGYEEHYPSIAVGTVSGRLRYVNLQQFIQIDAITDGGYSGGGIFNANGELVASPNEALGRGLSYGIAANQIISVITDLEQYGKIERGVLGVAWSEMRNFAPFSAVNFAVTPALHKKYPHSLVVADFAEKSAGRDAGMEAGDIITHIDGVLAQSAKLAQQYIGSKKPGAAVKFSIVRRETILEITVILDAFTENSFRYQPPE